jgi:hypothetical protein
VLIVEPGGHTTTARPVNRTSFTEQTGGPRRVVVAERIVRRAGKMGGARKRG